MLEKFLLPNERTQQLRAELAALIEKRSTLLGELYRADPQNAESPYNVPIAEPDFTIGQMQIERLSRRISNFAERVCELEEPNADLAAAQATATDAARLDDLPHHGHDDPL